MIHPTLDDSIGQKSGKYYKEKIGGHQQKKEDGVFGKGVLYMVHTHKIRQGISTCKNKNLHETSSSKKYYFCPAINSGL
jgi:hypothetical protein